MGRTWLGHRPVNVKRVVIGSKSWRKLRATFQSKEFSDWSIIKKWKK